MKNGKISESVLKRSVLKQLHTKSDRILFKPAVGEDCAVISMQAGGQTKLVTATQTFTLDVSDKHVRANCAVYDALNNIYAMGAGPVGIELALLVPTTENEAVLRETVRAIDAVCEEAGIVVLGGHTQVSRAVKNIVVTVTAIGEAYEQALTPSSAAAPGMDVIVTGYVGLEGTAILANEKRAELETRFSKAFIDKSAAYIDHISTAMEAASAIGAGVAAIHDASQGGIFGALWDMAEASGIGLDIDLKKLPIRQDTIEISEFFDINPYKLLSGGSLIIIAADGTRVVRELEKTGQNAVIVGATTDSNDRVLISGEERRFLETAQVIPWTWDLQAAIPAAGASGAILPTRWRQAVSRASWKTAGASAASCLVNACGSRALRNGRSTASSPSSPMPRPISRQATALRSM